MKQIKSGWRSRPSFPLVLLLLALSTVFLFSNDRDRFYRPGLHDWMSSEHLAIAVNLSPAHNFLMFHRLTGRTGSDYSYAPYNRFPVGGYALISLATLPFRGDLSAQLYAARMLMLAFFAGAAAAAYFAMARLCSSRWSALTAVLLSFSSYYCLYYNDVVNPEAMMHLFGVLLTFHGIVVFLAEGRFRQLLVKACAALLLGWHVLALILAFVVLGMASEIVRILREPSSGRDRGAVEPPVEAPVALLLRGERSRRYLTFGVVSLLLAATILAFNFVNEYASYDGERAWTDLSSVRSMLKRTGWDENFNERHADTSAWSPSLQLAWSPFLQEQFRRIGGLSMPLVLLPFIRAAGIDAIRAFDGADPAGSSLFVFGIVISVASLVCLTFFRFRPGLPSAALVASGFCWSLLMRHNTFWHDFECLFYIGIPLVVFAAGTSFASRLSRRGPACLAGAALLVFVVSGAEMSRVGYDDEAAGVQEALMADFEVIRRMTEGARIYADVRPSYLYVVPFAGARYAMHYYLAGSPIRFNSRGARRLPCQPGFVVTRERVEKATLLTPDNRLMFLYDRADYEAAGQPPLCHSVGRAGGTGRARTAGG